MKLLLLIYSGPTPERISALLELHDAPGFTQLEPARGAGSSGRMAGTRAWPGTSTVFMSVIPTERVTVMRAALLDYRSAAVEGEHLHVATMPIDDYL